MIAKCQKLIDYAKSNGFRNPEIKWGSHPDGISCYDIEGERLETDKEFEIRKTNAKDLEDREKTEYKRLKEKYGESV